MEYRYIQLFSLLSALDALCSCQALQGDGRTDPHVQSSKNLLDLEGPLRFANSLATGANDVANSFATSVSSRSLTMKQAMAIAACMEFAGSVTVGSRVADTIRTKIIDPTLYESQPAVLLLAMMCTLVGSSTFLTLATRFGLPVSTTHSVIGGLVGAGTASVGINKISWGFRGVSQVFAAWAIAPGIAGIFGATLFTITKHIVMTKRQAVKRAFFSIPVYTFVTVGALTSEFTPLPPCKVQFLISLQC